MHINALEIAIDQFFLVENGLYQTEWDSTSVFFLLDAFGH